MKANRNTGYAIITVLCIIIIAAMAVSVILRGKKSGGTQDSLPETGTHDTPEIHRGFEDNPQNGEELIDEDANPAKDNDAQPDADSAENKPNPSENKTEPQKKKFPSISEAELNKVIADNLPKDFPLSEISTKLNADSSLSIFGKGDKAKIIKYLESSGFQIPKIISASMNFLGDEVDLAADFKADKDAESGILRLSLDKVSVNDIEFNGSVLSAAIPDKVTEAINKALCDSNIYFTNVTVADGKIELNTDSET